MRTIALSEVMVTRGGSLNPANFPIEEFELYSIPAHDRGGPEVALGREIGSSKQIVQPRDVMISKIIPHIRRARVVGSSSGRRQIASGEWIVFRGSPFDPDYLRHFLISDNFHSQFMNTVAGVGGSLVRARPAQVKAIPLPLPPLPEQRRIAAILDQADAIRAKRRRVLAHLDSLAQAIFRDMFGDLSDTQPLSELVTEFRYGTSNKSGPTGHPTLRIPNIVRGGISHAKIKTVSVRNSELSRLALRDNDLLFVRTNGNPDNVGRCAVFTQSAVAEAGYGESPWIFASYLIRARLRDSAAAAFVATCLAAPAGRKHLRDRSKTSAGQYNINIDGIGSVPVPVSDRVRQVKFSTRIEQLDTRRTRLRAALAADDELFASLQSRAFRGEL